ncbi:molybdopterin dinucleotide binding domain-containing protein [Bacillus sp. V2I10]|uniref:molybdopterin dinucleotide binding domain-containing protein n=1 Tax=Bacillus sp. V2I10 TaxID=3042276 RepID=UPI003594898B
MHNLPVLVKRENRCTLWVHSVDAGRLELLKGDKAIVKSRTGKVEVIVQVTEDIMPGTVSLPHGWGHSLTGTRLQTASKHAVVNVNLLTDEQVIDEISGNAVLNGVSVMIEKKD